MPGGGVPMYGISLSVSIDHIATLRQARRGMYPDPVESAVICARNGCETITAHLREDRRHIQDRDVFAVRDAIRGKFNLEIALSDELIGMAKEVKPDRVTIVPEKKEEITTTGGLDIRQNMSGIKDTVKLFHDHAIPVSLLVEPDVEAVELSKECDADLIEIHTGTYCYAPDKARIDKEIGRIYGAADRAARVGIRITAAHGLDYGNIEPVLGARGLTEVTVGHSIVSRSLFVGLSGAVREMLEILE